MRTKTRAMVLLGATLITPLTACSKHAGSTGTSGGASAAASDSPGSTATSGGSGTSFGSGFEGAITMRTSGGHGETDLVFLTKGGKLRVDIPGRDGQTAHGIVDPAARKITVLMDTQKVAMQMAIPSPAAGGAAAGGDVADGKVTRTGKHETVAGYDCEDWDIAHPSGKHETACVAEGLSFFDLSTMAGTVGGVSSSWVEALRDKNGFPLRAVESDATGKEISRMEATKIEKKTLDAAEFEVPSTYRMVQMPGGLGGAAGAMGVGAHPARR
jgi:hypothetical protein